MMDLTPEQEAAADRLRVDLVQPILTLRDLVGVARGDANPADILDSIAALDGDDRVSTLLVAVYALVGTGWGSE